LIITRRDLDPGDLRRVLPHLTLIDRDDGKFRYRPAPWSAPTSPRWNMGEIRAIYERIFAKGRPNFTMGEYRSQAKTVRAISPLMLPLNDDGHAVNMVVFTRVTRFNRNITAGSTG
jgi:hypothetical protein